MEEQVTFAFFKKKEKLSKRMSAVATTLVIYFGEVPVKRFQPGKAKIIRECNEHFTVLTVDSAGTWTEKFDKPAYSYKKSEKK